ncbi:MAG: hypothetical protein AAB484_00495 [Patescibacteria group bacterium]
MSKVKYILVEVHTYSTGKTLDDFITLCPGFKLLEIDKNPYTPKVTILKLVNEKINTVFHK